MFSATVLGTLACAFVYIFGTAYSCSSWGFLSTSGYPQSQVACPPRPGRAFRCCHSQGHRLSVECGMIRRGPGSRCNLTRAIVIEDAPGLQGRQMPGRRAFRTSGSQGALGQHQPIRRHRRHGCRPSVSARSLAQVAGIPVTRSTPATWGAGPARRTVMRRAAERQIGTEIYGCPLRSLRIWSAISWIFRSVCCRAASAFEVRAAASRSRQVGLWLVRSARLDRLNQPTIPSLLPHRAAVTCPIPVLGLSMPRRTRDVHRAGDEAVSGSTQAHPDRHPAGELLQSVGRGWQSLLS
jgi:hypothetical protein